MNAKNKGESQSGIVKCILLFIFNELACAMNVDASLAMSTFGLKHGLKKRLIMTNNENIYKSSILSNPTEPIIYQNIDDGNSATFVNGDYPLFSENKNTEQIITVPICKRSPERLCQETTDIDLLYQEAAVAYPVLQDVTADIANQSNGIPVWPTQMLKARPRAVRKIIQSYGGDPSLQTDYIRTTINYDSVMQVYQGLEALKKEKRIEILRIKDRFKYPKANGYRDINIRLRILTNGHIGELQLHFRPFFQIKQFEDVIYHIIREKSACGGKASEDSYLTILKYISRKLYQRAYG